MIGGDFNTSLFRNESRHTISLNKFVEEECLYFCCNHVVSNVDFTFFSSTGTQTLIDHFIIISNMSQCITMYATLDILLITFLTTYACTISAQWTLSIGHRECR